MHTNRYGSYHRNERASERTNEPIHQSVSLSVTQEMKMIINQSIGMARNEAIKISRSVISIVLVVVFASFSGSQVAPEQGLATCVCADSDRQSVVFDMIITSED